MTPGQRAALGALVGRAITDEEAAQADAYLQQGRVNAITAMFSAGRVVVDSVSVAEFASWAAETGMRAVIEDHATDKASPLRSVALALRDVLSGAVGSISFARPANMQMLGAWQQAGSINASQKAQLLALATKPAPLTDNEIAEALGV